MIKAVIFDCFGVLATDGWLPFRDKYFGNDKALFSRAQEINRQVDMGKLPYNDFIRQIAHMAQTSEMVARRHIENNVPNERLFAFIKDVLKPVYKIGLLSNAAANWLDEIFTKQQVALFDAIALSYEMGAIKPSPRAYEIITQRLSVTLAECVFVDDQERYVQAARAIGMQALLYKDKDHEQFTRELKTKL